MPHLCTVCGHTFPDGSKEMLSGCPDCGGNKFQYFQGEIPDDPPVEDPPEPDSSGVTGTVGRAAKTVKDFVEGEDRETGRRSRTIRDGTTRPREGEIPPDDHDGGSPGDAEWPSAQDVADSETDSGDGNRQEPTAGEGGSNVEDPKTGDVTEDAAQTSARSDVVDTETIPDDIEGEVVGTPSGERPDMATLREELNDQFESIRIVDKGQYELNLMELYDREEYIIALQENGRYVIEVPDAWRNPEE
jgi:predicted  nucleic acid-binding Zn-ribbon protein